MKLHACIILAAGLTVAAAQKDDPAKDDAKKFQGDWSVISAERAGKADEDLKQIIFTFTGDKIVFKRGDMTREGTFKLDPTRKPKQISVTPVDRKETLEGIYTFDGDNLKLCLGDLGKDRPADFATKEGGQAVLFVLKRAKP